MAAARGERLDTLEGLRAAAALAVVAFHLTVLTEAFRTGWIGAGLLQLNVGVWLFFVLSGFLLYLPFASAHAGRDRVRIGSYLRRRALRIYPAYWFALGIILWTLTPAWRFPDVAAAARSALLVDSYVHAHAPTNPGLPQAWSLVVEISFYAFLPIYAALVGVAGRRFRLPRVEWIGVAALAVLGVLATAWPGNAVPLWVQALPVYLTPFAFGMAAAVARTQGLRWPRPGPWIAAAVVAWGATVVWSATGNEPNGLWWRVLCPLAFSVAAGGLVVPLVDPQARGRVAAWARSRPMVALGRVSYGIFLWHYGAIVWVTSHWFDPQGSFTLAKTAIVVLPFTWIAAIVSYRFVELPAMALGRRARSRNASMSGASIGRAIR